MKPTTKLINRIEKIVEHFASLSRGSNIHIQGGIGVNEKIAVPKGSFPVKIVPTDYSLLRNSPFPEYHKDGTLDVSIFQVAKKRPILSYELCELVPNSIILKLKKRDLADGIGIIAENSKWKSTILSYDTKYDLGGRKIPPSIELKDFYENRKESCSFFQHLWATGHNWKIPYLLVSPNVDLNYAIRLFLLKYNEENKENFKEKLYLDLVSRVCS